MLEHEPHRPNYDELKKAHEAALQSQPANQAEHKPSRQNYSELKAEQPAPARERDEVKPEQQPARANIIDSTEAKMDAYRKELQVEFEAGRIDKHEQIRREKLYDQQLASTIRSTPEGRAVSLPEPEPPRTNQQRNVEGQEGQGRAPFVKTPMDWERMLTDPKHRKHMEEQAKAERALRLQQQRGKRAAAPRLWRPRAIGVFEASCAL
jgi:hypothetical protein